MYRISLPFVFYGITCLIRLVESAKLFATFEESVCCTSSVRQVVPPAYFDELSMLVSAIGWLADLQFKPELHHADKQSSSRQGPIHHGSRSYNKPLSLLL